MDTLAAAGTGTALLGSIGAGGLALVLAVVLALGTKSGGEHGFSKNVALFIGLAAGTAWMGAGQIWGMPDDLVITGLRALGVGTGGGEFGTIGMGAIALCLVAIVYLMKLAPRTAGFTGVAMATVFSAAGGAWAMIAISIAQFFGRFA